jgi:hypothetical protein
MLNKNEGKSGLMIMKEWGRRKMWTCDLTVTIVKRTSQHSVSSLHFSLSQYMIELEKRLAIQQRDGKEDLKASQIASEKRLEVAQRGLENVASRVERVAAQYS